MSSGEAEYISAAVACMKASHIKMLEYDLKHLGAKSYDLNNPSCEPSKLIIDNEATKAMSGGWGKDKEIPLTQRI